MNLLKCYTFFGDFRFQAFYRLYEFRFLTTIGNKYVYGLPLVEL